MAKKNLEIEVKGRFDSDEFRVKFRAFFAVLGFVAAMAFLFVAILNESAQASKYTGTILGFMTGTLVTLVFTYYFGSSDESKSRLPKIPETENNDSEL